MATSIILCEQMSRLLRLIRAIGPGDLLIGPFYIGNMEIYRIELVTSRDFKFKFFCEKSRLGGELTGWDLNNEEASELIDVLEEVLIKS